MGKLLLDIDITPERCVMKPENQGALTIRNNQGSNGRAKHIDIKHLYVQDLVKECKMELEYCKPDDLAVDMLTKPLEGANH